MSTSASTFSYSITGLTEGLFYNVAVQATNVFGNSLLSSSATIVAALAPQPPTNIQAIQQSSTSITISWFAVTGTSNRGSPITGYYVYWQKTTDSTYTLAGTTTANTLSLQKSVTSPGSYYNFIISAINGAGAS